MHNNETLIFGDISGIQTYLFEVPQTGGGQARQLRGRSFFLRLLPELIALRLLRRLQWGSDEHFIFSAAGKFALRGEAITASQLAELYDERQRIEQCLAGEARGNVRFALAVTSASTQESILSRYEDAQTNLLRDKLQPFNAWAITNNQWREEALVLPPPPDPQAEAKRFVELGKALTTAERIGIYAVRETPSADNGLCIAGFDVRLSKSQDTADSGALRTFSLSGSTKQPRPAAGATAPMPLRLARHVPLAADGDPLDFDAIAKQSRGAAYQGILKMDADGLGSVVSRILVDATDFSPLQALSERLDTFFAVTLDEELRKPQWSAVYTIFSGGDDLLLTGPWDIIFDYASHVRQLFMHEFRDLQITISGAMTLTRAKLPIRHGVHQVEELLHLAKTRPAEGQTAAKDQFAAFGSVWKWTMHEEITRQAKQLADWVDAGIVRRGWLHTLLDFVIHVREPQVAARLHYHIGQNYPKPDDRDPDKAAFRRWADSLMSEFDKPARIEALCFAAILSYALTATRSKGED